MNLGTKREVLQVGREKKKKKKNPGANDKAEQK